MIFFSDAIIAKIMKIAGQLTDDKRQAMQVNLRDAAFHYMTALYSTPLRLTEGPEDVKLSRRVEYLDRHLISPIDQLLAALTPEHSHLLSEWPKDRRSPAPDRKTLITELRRLRDRTEELRDHLVDRKRNTNLTQEFLTDLGSGLTSVLKTYYPRLNVSRGTHYKKTEGKVGNMHGEYLDVIAICIGEILPNEDALSSNLIGELRKLRGR